MLAVLQESFWERLAGVIGLKRPTYEAIRRDAATTSQAWWIVLLLGLSQGIVLVTTPDILMVPGLTGEMAAELERLSAQFTFDTTDQQVLGLLASIAGLVLTWYLTSWLLATIGNRLARPAGQPVTTAEMRRLVAWGYSPSLAWYLLPIPVIGPFLGLLGWIWSLVTGIMAVRAAFGVGIWQALVIRIAAFLATVGIIILIAVALTTVAVLLT